MPLARAVLLALVTSAFVLTAGCTTSDPASPQSAEGPGSFGIDGGHIVVIDARIDDAPADAPRDEGGEADGGIGDSGTDSDRDAASD